MTNTDSQTRPWDWTPSPGANRFMTTLLRLPVLHRLLSGAILLISFTGRKSGQRYTTPVGYIREGERVIILTKRFRKWWHNFEEPAPVTLRIKGRDYQGTAVALTDEETIIPHIANTVQQQPRSAEIYGVKLHDGVPDSDDVRRLAPKIVVIEVTLAA